jgi:hypothetical protein
MIYVVPEIAHQSAPNAGSIACDGQSKKLSLE